MRSGRGKVGRGVMSVLCMSNEASDVHECEVPTACLFRFWLQYHKEEALCQYPSRMTTTQCRIHTYPGINQRVGTISR